MGDVHRFVGASSRVITAPLPVRPVRALAISAGLSFLFVVVYGGCNWISAHRSDVGTLYFRWEQAISFVPLFIIPYLSIDLFFVAAPFLCRSERELRTFTARTAAAIVCAGLVFLLFPLRYAFPRPHAPGWLGLLFAWFQGIDAPHNLLPSLHAALALLLVDIYARHSCGILRVAIIIWFMFIGVSPLLTHQHHVMDIVAGFALAGYCFYFVRDFSPRLSMLPNPGVGLYYLVGTGGVLVFALFNPVAGAFLLWPVLSLVLVALAYFGRGPGIFRKTDGVLPLSSRFVLGPCLAGQYLSFAYYRRKCAAWNAITPCVLMGRRLNNDEAAAVCRAGVTAVLDVSAEFSEVAAFRALAYGNVPVLDLTAPTLPQLNEMVRFIEDQAAHGKVYVHCKVGYSRSAAAVGAYLMASGQATGTTEAIDIIRSARASVVIRPEVVSALQEFEMHLRNSGTSRAFLLASTGEPVS